MHPWIGGGAIRTATVETSKGRPILRWPVVLRPRPTRHRSVNTDGGVIVR